MIQFITTEKLTKKTSANSADPDQEQSDLVLHCLISTNIVIHKIIASNKRGGLNCPNPVNNRRFITAANMWGKPYGGDLIGILELSKHNRRFITAENMWGKP